jgi:acyl-CoA synthetase (AMP-forming)/AMP-acid ligase II
MRVLGGCNVFPRHIEDVLASYPAVAQWAVIGMLEPKWDETVPSWWRRGTSPLRNSSR